MEATVSEAPPGLLLRFEGSTVLAPAPAGPGGELGAFGFQTTSSVGARRWRSGPAQWKPGPDNELAPPSTGWWSATAPLDAAGGQAVFATDHPDGRRIVVAHRARSGRASLTVSVTAGSREAAADDVEAVGACWVAVPGERWMGFGERSDRAVRSEGVVEHYVGEGPYQEWEYPFLGATVPAWALRQRLDASYFPLPWALSTAGYGVWLGDDALSYTRLRPGGREVWSFEVEAPVLHVEVAAGPHPLDALGRFTAETGRQAEPERWWWGPWWQTGHDNHVPTGEEMRQLDRLRAARAPVSAAETHCRYLPLGEHRGHTAAEAERVANLHARGVAVLSYLNPLVGADFDEAFAPASADGALAQRPDGSTYTFEAYAGGRNPPVTLETHYDFSNPAAGGHWAAVAAELFAAGYDGWMEDFGEYTPLDAHLAAGSPAGTAGHNRYPTDYHAAAAGVAASLGAGGGAERRRPARFVRSGWTGTAAVAPIVWGGDPTTGWGFDGLASAVTEAVTAGCSGVAMWGSDIGGFLSSVEQLTPELLCRWIELGALTPVMRTKSSGIGPPDVVRPQIWDDGIVEVWARWAAWHTQLNDYLGAAHDLYRRTGRPVVAPLALVDPGGGGDDVEDQYLLGPDLLVAPVLADGARDRRVRLPAGGWVDLWGCAAYDPATRGVDLTGGATVHEGPAEVTVGAPLDEVPILARVGSVLALLPPDVDSLSPYRAPGVVSAADRHGERRLLCLPAGPWSGVVAPAEGGAGPDDLTAASSTGPGVWTLHLPSAPALATRRWLVDADLGLLPGGAPAGVEVAGAATGWSYDPATGVLRAEVTGAGPLTATAASP